MVEERKKRQAPLPLDPKAPETDAHDMQLEDLPVVDPEAPQPPDPDQPPPIEHETDPSRRPPVVPEAPQPPED